MLGATHFYNYLSLTFYGYLFFIDIFPLPVNIFLTEEIDFLLGSHSKGIHISTEENV